MTFILNTLNTDNRLEASTPGYDFYKAVQTPYKTLSGLNMQVAETLANHREAVQKARADVNLSAQGKAAQVAKASETALQALQAVQGTRAQTEGDIRKAIAKGRESQKVDTQTALLNEMQEQRAWSRAARLLDAQTDPSDVLRIVLQLAQTGDAAMLSALIAESPAYMESRRMGGMVASVLDQLNAAYESFLPPSVSAARQTEQAVTEGLGRLDGAIKLAYSQLAEGGLMVNVLPDFTGGTLDITD